jgi:hypothetical protein
MHAKRSMRWFPRNGATRARSASHPLQAKVYGAERDWFTGGSEHLALGSRCNSLMSVDVRFQKTSSFASTGNQPYSASLLG